MSVIEEMSPASGNVIGADGNEYNLVTLMGGGTPVSNRVYDVANYQPRSALILGEDGKVYDLVQLIQSGGGKGGGVSDVKINGESTVQEGVANIPVASGSKPGVVLINYRGAGLQMSGSTLMIAPTTNIEIDNRTNGTMQPTYCPITPARIDYAVKAAMCDGKGEPWSEEERNAACERIGACRNQFEVISDITISEESVPIFQFTKGYSKVLIIEDASSVDSGKAPANRISAALSSSFNKNISAGGFVTSEAKGRFFTFETIDESYCKYTAGYTPQVYGYYSTLYEGFSKVNEGFVFDKIYGLWFWNTVPVGLKITVLGVV